LPYFQFQNNEHDKKDLHHYLIYKRCKHLIIINFFYLAVTQAKPSHEFLDYYIGLLLAFECPGTWKHIHPALTIHLFHIVKEQFWTKPNLQALNEDSSFNQLSIKSMICCQQHRNCMTAGFVSIWQMTIHSRCNSICFAFKTICFTLQANLFCLARLFAFFFVRLFVLVCCVSFCVFCRWLY
jgi:hypothetical protein